MGFFDKAKHFMGGHGVKVEHIEIERQSPAEAALPIGDTVVKGKFQVASDKDCTVLSMKAALLMEVKHPDGRVENVELGEDHFPDQYTSRSDDMLKYPYELKGGATTEDFFIISMKSDIPSELQKRSLQPNQVRVFVKTMVDVKGSPFDPEATNDIRLSA